MALDQEPIIDHFPAQVDRTLDPGITDVASHEAQQLRDDPDLVDLRVVAGLGALNGHQVVVFTGDTAGDGRYSGSWAASDTVDASRDSLTRMTATAESCGMSASDWSLCLIKPDAKAMGIESIIRKMIVADGLRILATREQVQIDQEQLDKIWPPYDEHGNLLPPNPWWEATVAYMTSAPIDALLVQGPEASIRMKALKAELRRMYYGDGYQNDHSLAMCERVKSIIHSSDCDRELVSNVLAFWNAQELSRIVASAKFASVV